MMNKTGLMTVVAVIAIGALPAAAEGVKIGMITTLSGGGARVGADVRAGFELAVELRGGRLGGVETELIVADDGLDPETGKRAVKRMLRQDDVDIVVGSIWSNVALAVAPAVVRAEKFYVSPNAGPSELAGKGCHPNYFNIAWQNDEPFEALGWYMTDTGVESVYIVTPNYPAGRDSVTGFKRFFGGEIVAETYTRLGQIDYAAECQRRTKNLPLGGAKVGHFDDLSSEL
jgi:branched-chain amino acid transport system substrate-binding protein